MKSNSSPQGTTQRYRITGPLTAEQHARLSKWADEVPIVDGESPGAETLDVFIPPSRVKDLLDLVPTAQRMDSGQPFSLVEDAQGTQPDEGYFTNEEIIAELDQLAGRFPGVATKVNLSELPGAAKTGEGRSIFALRVTGTEPSSTPKRAVVIAQQHHARELNSTFTGIELMRHLLADSLTDPEIKKLLATTEIYFVPTVNPDGLNHVWTKDNYWRKNRRPNADGTFGVDPNRNYTPLWGKEGSSPSGSSEIYRGTGPASEPEVQTMIALAKAVCPELYFDLHSSGQEVLTLYPSKAAVSEPIASMGKHYASELESKAKYAGRPPSGSGEAPHEFWMKHGALSYLIEIGRSFQPPIAEAKKEEPRVWAALRHALTTWKPAARGQVQDQKTGAPVSATFTAEAGLFLEGESTQSRASDGNFSLWLPPGKHQVTVSAKGYQPQTVAVDVARFDQTVDLKVQLQPTAA